MAEAQYFSKPSKSRPIFLETRVEFSSYIKFILEKLSSFESLESLEVAVTTFTILTIYTISTY